MSSGRAHGRLRRRRSPNSRGARLGRGSTTGGARACGARGLPAPSAGPGQDPGTVSSNVVPAER